MVRKHKFFLLIGLNPGFNPIKNIYRSEKFSEKSHKIWKPHMFSVKPKNFMCRFLGAASWADFDKTVDRTENFYVLQKNEVSKLSGILQKNFQT